jgi:precorrin-6A/cobalt-precorrin-6A reductase
MILLLGGTSDTARVAQRLAEAGQKVLVSTATDEALAIGDHPAIRRRSGRLDEAGLADLVRRESIAAIVDATHPYATEISTQARTVAASLGISFVSFVRPPAVEAPTDGVQMAESHAEAARLAFAGGGCVLLTTGSNNVDVYAEEAQRSKRPLFVRVLLRDESLAQCEAVGIPPDRIIAARGPFDVAQNREQIRNCRADVLVTKDGGHAAGVRDKLQAARLEGCRVIVVRRPKLPTEQVFDDPEPLVRHVLQMLLDTDESKYETV